MGRTKNSGKGLVSPVFFLKLIFFYKAGRVGQNFFKNPNFAKSSRFKFGRVSQSAEYRAIDGYKENDKQLTMKRVMQWLVNGPPL